MNKGIRMENGEFTIISTIAEIYYCQESDYTGDQEEMAASDPRRDPNYSRQA